MLVSLHVKNLALIDEEEIEFSRGLNILSGETGAGKSIILGALHLTLGDKAPKDLLRDSSKEALVEAVYTVTDQATKMALEAMDIDCSEDEIIMSRRLTDTRAVCKINGEQVPAAKMKAAGNLLLDIYGQKEHQSLLNKAKHLELLDDFIKADAGELKQELKETYAIYKSLSKEYQEAKASDASKDREMVLLDYEINEIESARLKIGEDQDLEEDYRRLSNYSKTMEYFGKAHEAMSADGGVSDAISRAMSDLHAIEHIDDRAGEFLSMLSDADSIISDFNRELASYMADATFDQETFTQTENRLNEINRLKDKYGNTIEAILEALAQRQEKKLRFESYDQYLSQLKQRLEDVEATLNRQCMQLSELRRSGAKTLSCRMQEAMADLNFLNTDFDMEFSRLDHFTDNGFDDVQFMISTNPGQPVRPLKDIASGGEMSRIMLAIKTVLASKEGIDTLIFDEIDAGISGRTAQAVSEKLAVVARDHQVICITHLPQIASMADAHFLIEKNVKEGHTISGISRLSEESSVMELARMLGGSAITEAVISNARELLQLAADFKKN